jgi:hypothetical protein
MLLDLAVERGGVSIAEMATDDLARDIFGAGREALCFIAERVTAEYQSRFRALAPLEPNRAKYYESTLPQPVPPPPPPPEQPAPEPVKKD